MGQELLQGKPGRVFVDVPLPAQTCKAGLPIEIEALADMLGELMLAEKHLDAHVMAALPQEAVHWRVLDWASAPAPEEAIEALRALNPELGLPFPLSEATIDLRPLLYAMDIVTVAPWPVPALAPELQEVVIRCLGSCRNDGNLLRPDQIAWMLEQVAGEPLIIRHRHRSRLVLREPSRQQVNCAGPETASQTPPP